MNKNILLFAVSVFAFSCTINETHKKENMKTTENPLLVKSRLPYNAPDFTKIKNEHFLPAILEGMKLQNKEIEKIVSNTEASNFKNTILALEESDKVLSNVQAVFPGLAGAHTNDVLKANQKELAPKLSKHQDNILLNTTLSLIHI